MIEYLTIEDVLDLVEDLGVGPIRDIGLLESAAHRPLASAFGQEAYPDLDTKAAVLLESLVGNHALVDGNKRIGWLSTVVFYVLNGVRLDVPDDDAYRLVIAVAGGQLGYPAVAEQFAAWRAAATD
ncbi:type II toxin-antitoxin system death-on-curing family toxin [Acidipropionibacterium virtanenii]|uniref:Toxin Doc n=1 Tax=Acidipropionibacterium virtanenii TaxID=2057246 RepID=A0A344UT23_9ACTN|nr:Fic family protein [Acidipropionibacterium virtanenii]AXE38421.1 Toxin Doc [Acidipropionibacterium virtanenii]